MRKFRNMKIAGGMGSDKGACRYYFQAFASFAIYFLIIVTAIALIIDHLEFIPAAVVFLAISGGLVAIKYRRLGRTKSGHKLQCARSNPSSCTAPGALREIGAAEVWFGSVRFFVYLAWSDCS